MDNLQDLAVIIKGCRDMQKASQEKLYRLFYNYAWAVSIRYISNVEEAQEVVNDSFVKVFMRLKTHYDENLPFKAWFRRIIINTALDRYKAKQIFSSTCELHEDYQIGVHSDIIEQLTREQVLKIVEKLPPQYRTVFNLYVVDGFNHPEIAGMLNISEVTSRSNLTRARQALKKILQEKIY
jgi:RNA polymerase sigma-70 factor (ECF subfamily)